MKVISLLGGPGAGKSTNAALLFGQMKLAGHKVELVTEYAKDMVYENRSNILEDQLYMFAKQARRLSRLRGSVDYVVTDTSLLLSLVYNKHLKNLDNLILEVYNSYNNLNFFINRTKEYKQYGRNQTETEARALDNSVARMLQEYQIQHTIVGGYQDILELINA